MRDVVGEFLVREVEQKVHCRPITLTLYAEQNRDKFAGGETQWKQFQESS